MKPVNTVEFEAQRGEIVKVAVRAVPNMDELAEPKSIAAIQEMLKPNIDAAKSCKVSDGNSREVAFALARLIKPFGTKLDDTRKELNRVLKAEVDNRLNPVIIAISEGVSNCEGQIRAFDLEALKKAQEAQRKADEQRAREQAELERRRKIQDAAVEAGKEKRKEIPVEAPKTEIAVPVAVAEDKRVHFRLRYEVVDVNLLPNEYVVRQPNRAKIQERCLAIEATFPKDRKGVEGIEQKVPGVRMYWESEYRLC
jgi:hypothetical protein